MQLCGDVIELAPQVSHLAVDFLVGPAHRHYLPFAVHLYRPQLIEFSLQIRPILGGRSEGKDLGLQRDYGLILFPDTLLQDSLVLLQRRNHVLKCLHLLLLDRHACLVCFVGLLIEF